MHGEHVPKKKHLCKVHDAARNSEPYEVESGFRTDVYIIPQELPISKYIIVFRSDSPT